MAWLTEGVSNLAVGYHRKSPPTPSTTAGQHQLSSALGGEDGLGTTNDGCGRSVEQPEKKYRPIKGVGWRCRVVVRGWWVDKRTRVEFELN